MAGLPLMPPEPQQKTLVPSLPSNNHALPELYHYANPFAQAKVSYKVAL